MYDIGATGIVRLRLLPAGRAPVVRRVLIEEPETRFGVPPWCTPWADEPESIVQVALAGDESPAGYAQGMSMRGGPATGSLRFAGQRSEGSGIVTRLEGPQGLEVEHRLVWCPGGVRCSTAVRNGGTQPLGVDLLTSFVLDGLTPFAPDDGVGRLRVHRARAAWSAEGRWECRTLEELGLERSWQPHAVRCERFGQVGSLPVRGWFPCVVVEDVDAGVCWGAQLAWPGSWQMELYRRGDALSLSGGLADHEFGHWRKCLAPGETLVSPPALLTVVEGDVDACCRRLARAQEHLRDRPDMPGANRKVSTGLERTRQASWLPLEEDLPVVCNEFCSSWGQPTHASLEALARRLQGSGVRHLVIDAGWYADPGRNWCDAHGDWQPSLQRFPDGLEATAAMIRSYGLVPGLWLEPETVGKGACAFNETEGLLHRDGVPVTVGSRRFRDLRQERVFEALVAQTVGLVRRCHFGYIKFDYNETIGIGVDGAESPGEGLRQQMDAVLRFYARLRAELPDVVVEHCASGGHRLEPAMLALADMASFSDAHESRGIPLLAAAQHRLVAPRQMQLWAVLRKEHSAEELRRTLANGFLGRLCLSGDLAALDTEQWNVVQDALALYRRATPLIRDGKTRVHGNARSGSWRHPSGSQVVVRTASDGAAALVVAHAFANPAGGGADLHVPLPSAGPGRRWRVGGSLAGAEGTLRLVDGVARIAFSGSTDHAGVWLLDPVPEAHPFPRAHRSGRRLREPLPEAVPA